MAGSGVDVLVVGAGPTGLTAALELAAAGVRCRIVDQAAERSERSRALVLQARTLELLARHGLADRLVARGQRSFEIGLYVQRELAAEAAFRDIGVKDSPYPFLLFLSQAETEELLEARLAEQGVRVERPAQVTALAPSPEGAQVTLRHGDGREEALSARYVVGADGAHSVVRKAAGLTFEGAAYEQDFMLADVQVDWALPRDRVHFLLGEHSMMTVLPLRDCQRLISLRPKGSHPETDPTLAELQAVLEDVAPVKATLRDPVWLTRFRLHHRAVDRYRQGPLFVAGDAAHIHSPVGGQGMNTGIQDAVNLGWKLADVLKGRAGEPLLDSYHDERLPVGQRLLHFTDRFFGFVASGNSFVVAARNYLAPKLVPLALKSPATREHAFRFVSQLAISYRASPIVSESCMDTHDLFHGGPRAGDRVPDAPLTVRSGLASHLQAELTPAKHTLLLFPCTEQAEVTRAAVDRARELADWIEPVVVGPPGVEASAGVRVWEDPSGEVQERLGIRHCAHVLVRPDGYIAYRSTGLALEGVPLFLKRAYGATLS